MLNRTSTTTGVHVVVSRVAYLAICCGLLIGAGLSQTTQTVKPDNKLPYASDPANVPDAISRVKSGDLSGVYLEMIANAKAAGAIPVLESRFAQSRNSMDKAHIASVLVRLGVDSDVYWDFLMKSARASVDSDAPAVAEYDSDGKPLPGPSPALIQWANAHHLSRDKVGEYVLFNLPAPVAFLAMTGDPRGEPLLREALLSPNFMIQIQAALGLAKIKDENSVPLIIDACHRAPKEVAAAIAGSLVYFDDADAQQAFDQYVPKEKAQILREEKAKGRTPFR